MEEGAGEVEAEAGEEVEVFDLLLHESPVSF